MELTLLLIFVGFTVALFLCAAIAYWEHTAKPHQPRYQEPFRLRAFAFSPPEQSQCYFTSEAPTTARDTIHDDPDYLTVMENTVNGVIKRELAELDARRYRRQSWDAEFFD